MNYSDVQQIMKLVDSALRSAAAAPVAAQKEMRGVRQTPQWVRRNKLRDKVQALLRKHEGTPAYKVQVFPNGRYGAVTPVCNGGWDKNRVFDTMSEAMSYLIEDGISQDERAKFVDEIIVATTTCVEEKRYV